MYPPLSLLFGLSLVAQSSALVSGASTRIACVGASITAGFGTTNPVKDNYAVQMQILLGPAYDVRNFGVGGCTMMKQGDRPYWSEPSYREALAFNPAIVVIDLGGNDSKAINWKHKEEFAADTRTLITSFRVLPSHPRVLLCLPMPSFTPPSSEINDDVITKEQIPIMRQVAFETGTELIDQHTPFIDKKIWLADGVHPNTEGAALMAKVIGGVIANPIDPGFDIEDNLEKQGIKATVTSFHGYRQLNFTMANGHQCAVVRPVVTAAGRSFVWRGEFFGHEPQTDLALLERGYHIVYIDTKDMFGAPPAMAIWEEFHVLLSTVTLRYATSRVGRDARAGAKPTARPGPN